jgi:hypothetical protein
MEKRSSEFFVRFFAAAVVDRAQGEIRGSLLLRVKARRANGELASRDQLFRH